MEKLKVSKRMLHSAEQTFVGLVFEWLYSVASYNYRQLDVVSLQLPFVKHGVPLLIGQGMRINIMRFITNHSARAPWDVVTVG